MNMEDHAEALALLSQAAATGQSYPCGLRVAIRSADGKGLDCATVIARLLPTPRATGPATPKLHNRSVEWTDNATRACICTFLKPEQAKPLNAVNSAAERSLVIAAYEFGKRILIQRQCELCKGSGLIQKGRYARKCTSCGGFLPWQSWGQFFTSEAGNGGVVRVPKGQTSVFYDVEAARLDGKRQAAEAEAAKAGDDADAQREDTPAR